MEILDRFNKVLIMAAHVHTISRSYLGLEFGRANPNTAHQILVAAASGSWWTGPKDEYGIPSATQRDGSPKGIHHLTFYENSYHERFKAAGLSKSHQIRIEDPSGFKGHSDSTLTHLVVNVFNGSERSTVEARINHEEWKSLANKSNGYSPHFKRLKQNEQTGDWIHPIPTNHIWELELPEDLKPGFHLLEVRTTDQYGKAYSKSKVFEFIQAD